MSFVLNFEDSADVDDVQIIEGCIGDDRRRGVKRFICM